MSTNMYGFTCNFIWKERRCFTQIVYSGTSEFVEDSLESVTDSWETQDPALLAKYELDHRDWSKKLFEGVRIEVAGVYPGLLDTDPYRDPNWKTPTPTEKEVLQIIANGEASDIAHGWDT